MEFKKNFRKGLAMTTLATVVAGVAPASAQQFSWTDSADIPDYAREAVQELADQGVMTGNDDGSYAPDRALNRAEVAKVIVLATDMTVDTAGGPHFPDVEAGAWYYDYIETMFNQGHVKGYPDGQFRPGVTINRAEMAKMVINAFEIPKNTDGGPHFSDVNSSDWFYGYVETAYNYEIMRGFGDGTFDPATTVSRAETARILYDAQIVAAGGSVGGGDDDDDTASAAGTLEVELSAQTPRGTNIPYNATSVPFTTLALSASDDEDVAISSLSLTRLGLGDNDDFDKVWLEIDGFKVGSDKSVNSSDVVTLTFNPPITVQAGQTIVADVVASLEDDTLADDVVASNASHFNRFALVSSEDVTSSAQNVVGDFPVEGEEMEIANYAVSEVEFDAQGSDTTISVGDQYTEIGKFRMVNNSESDKDMELRAITFKNEGSADLEEVLANVGLYASSELISPEVIIDGDYITFRLDDGITGGYILEDGDSKTFSIRADILAADKDDDIQLKIDNFEDIVGVEVGTNFGVRAIGTDNEPAEDGNATLKEYTIEAGDLNISRAPGSLNNQEYAPGANDVVFLTAKVTTDQPITVDGVTLDVDDFIVESGATSDIETLEDTFDNFRLYLDDQLIGSEDSFTGSDAAPTLEFDSSFEIAGSSVLKLVGNVDDNAATGRSVKFTLDDDGFDSPEYISTGESLEDSDTVGSAEASYVEVQESELQVTLSDGYTIGSATAPGEEIVAGVSDVTVMEFIIDNNDSGDVEITSLEFLANATGAASNLSNFTAGIFVDGVLVGSTKTLDPTTSFNDISVTIPSSSQKEFAVVMNTQQAAAGGTPDSATMTGAPAATLGVNTPENVYAAANGDLVALSASTQITLPTGGSLIALSAGDQVIISTDGTNTVVGAEIKTLAADVLLGDTIMKFTTALAQTHGVGEAVSAVTTDYSAVSTTAPELTLDDVSDFTVGDMVTIGSDVDVCEITAISGNDVTFNCVDTDANAADGGDNDVTITAGLTVTAAGSDSTLELQLINVDAENAENGQEVDVTRSANTNVLSGTNPEMGAYFAFIASGQLTVSETSQIENDSNVIVADSGDVEVFKFRVNATDDSIEIKDVYLTNAAATNGGVLDGRSTFKIYNEAGQLLGEETLVGGKLHFELSNSNRINVPVNDSTIVTVKVDTSSITQAAKTGGDISLAFDTAEGTNGTGIEAVTEATGADITDANAITQNVTTAGEQFVVYRTALELAHASSQPSFSASTSGGAMYRFTVTNDAAGDAILDQITLKVGMSDGGVHTLATGAYGINRYSSSAYSGTPTAVALAADGTVAGDEIKIEFAAEENIDGTAYYELVTTAAIVGVDDNDSFNVSFVSDAAAAVSQVTTHADAITALGGANKIVWSDRSNQGNPGAYLNGFELIMPSSSDTDGASE